MQLVLHDGKGTGEMTDWNKVRKARLQKLAEREAFGAGWDAAVKWLHPDKADELTNGDSEVVDMKWLEYDESP